MKNRLVACVIGICSLLVVAAPASAVVRTASGPPEPPVWLCIDLGVFRLFCPPAAS